jgi:2-polyprenyl-3-methyl-5-hydroxy-6-metoxy-1,4-benzoquinol methylase
MYREKIIEDFCKGKNVLDVGSVGQNEQYCLWDIIKNSAKTVTGIDLPQAEDVAIKALNVPAKGVSHSMDERIIRGNMETYEFGKTFDVIVAGDIIEHVSNPGLFMDNVKKHLSKDGKFILTTPNAKWLTVLFKPNKTHVLWYDIYTLRQLVERHGLKIEWFKYYMGNKPFYNPFLQPLLIRQQILAVISIA